MTENGVNFQAPFSYAVEGLYTFVGHYEYPGVRDSSVEIHRNFRVTVLKLPSRLPGKSLLAFRGKSFTVKCPLIGKFPLIAID